MSDVTNGRNNAGENPPVPPLTSIRRRDSALSGEEDVSPLQCQNLRNQFERCSQEEGSTSGSCVSSLTGYDVPDIQQTSLTRGKKIKAMPPSDDTYDTVPGYQSWL